MFHSEHIRLPGYDFQFSFYDHIIKQNLTVLKPFQHSADSHVSVLMQALENRPGSDASLAERDTQHDNCHLIRGSTILCLFNPFTA